DRAGAPFAVVQREAAFGRGVVLQNLRNAEAALELFPDLRPQAVAAAQPERVPPLLRPGRGREQITAQFTDALKERAALLHEVLSEFECRVSLVQHHGTEPYHRRAG